jgi:hypothetical protein
MKSTLLALGLLVFSVDAWGEDCPVQFGVDNYLDRVASAIKSTTNCAQAVSVAEACALGASGDSFTVPFAERKCGLDFWKKLSPADKKIYGSLQAKCDHKYENMQGTLYISLNAFCRLRVAQLYSELYSPAE